jgi:hypothetical protein
VLTDHGRAHGSELDSEGVARPAVIGQRLSGRHGTPRVADTDAGLLDRDSKLDRAVGPMLLLPAVWSVVRVDADSGRTAQPQDVEDAALGAAVLLCAGPGAVEPSDVHESGPAQPGRSEPDRPRRPQPDSQRRPDPLGHSESDRNAVRLPQPHPGAEPGRAD